MNKQTLTSGPFAPSLSTPETELLLSASESDLLELAGACRTHIRNWTEHALKYEQTGDRARAMWLWMIMLGTLAWDISGSVILLLTHRELRTGKILCRSLTDYAVRLEYYAYNPDAAEADLAEAPKWLRKFLKPGESLYQNDSDWQALQPFLAGDVKTKNRRTREMMEFNLQKAEPARKQQLFAYMHDREYGIGSALAHGNAGAIWDVFSDIDGVAEKHQWSSRGVHTTTLALDLAHALLGFVRAFAATTNCTEDYECFLQADD